MEREKERERLVAEDETERWEAAKMAVEKTKVQRERDLEAYTAQLTAAHTRVAAAVEGVKATEVGARVADFLLEHAPKRVNKEKTKAVVAAMTKVSS